MALNINPEDLDNLSERELKALAESLSRLSQKSFLDYKPTPYQKEFHLSPAKTRLIIGGNRSGKTISSFHDVIWELTGCYPDWYPENLKTPPPVYTRWIATDFKQGVGGVFQPYFDELVPSSFIRKVVKTQQGIVSKVFFKNGSILEILTDEQDLGVFEGWHGHRVHIDEPCARQRYIASIRGLIDYGGRVSFSLTPLKEPWIFDELYDKADGINIFAKTVSTTDNPHLSKADIEEFERSLNDDEKEARIHGKFIHLSGLVYKEFDKSIHVVKNFEIPFDWKRIHVLDPHDRKPHALIWAAVDPFDNLYVYDELEVNGTLKELATIILAKENKTKIDLRIIDPNKGKSPSEIGKAGKITDELARNKVYYWAGVNDDITEGHFAVKDYLKWDRTKPKSSSNRPKLYVMDNCVKTINGFTHYVWDDFRDVESKDKKEKPKDIYKDFPDLIRYLCISQPKYKSLKLYTRGKSSSVTGY